MIAEVAAALSLLSGLTVASRPTATRDLARLEHSRDEIGRLTAIFNGMVEGLRAKNQLRELFGKCVDPRMVSQLAERPLLMGEGGERRLLTIMFCDIRGFTKLSEDLTPSALVRFLNRYLTVRRDACSSASMRWRASRLPSPGPGCGCSAASRARLEPRYSAAAFSSAGGAGSGSGCGAATR